MSTSTMNISLPEALKRFVKERTKVANYSNPSDYVRSLIREDQRRLAATNLLDQMIAKHIAANPTTSPAKLEKLRGEFWTRWTELKTEIDSGLASLDQNGGKELNADMLANIKRRGRERLAVSKAV
jgi:putative addiction module CopG family antidote